MRTNVLHIQQITKEITSLEKSLALAKAACAKEEVRLAGAQRQAITEIERTAQNEEGVLEGVELERGEEDQGRLLLGAMDSYHPGEHAEPIEHIHQDHTQHDTSDPSGPDTPLWKKRTSEVYRTKGHLPQRFDRPALWRYEIKSKHPLYATTASDYGNIHPSVHEMPTAFHGQSSKFSKHLNQAGPYRNCSLNTK